MRLACSGLADQNDRFRTFDVVTCRQLLHLRGRDFRRLREIKLVQRLHPWQVGFSQATLHRVSFPLFQFCCQQYFQITQMILAFPYRLFG